MYRLWNWRSIHAYWLCQKFESFGCHGANALEQVHSTLKNILLFLKYEGISLKRLAPIAAIQMLYIYYKRLDNLLHLNGAKLMREYPDSLDMIKRMYKKMDEIRGFSDIYTGYDDFNQKLLYYENISIDVSDYLDGVKWQDALLSTTDLNEDDTDIIWRFIDENEDDFVMNSGWMKSSTKLNELKKYLSKKISNKDLKNVLREYWFAPDTDSEDDIDEADEDDVYRKLSGKKKKLDELSHWDL